MHTELIELSNLAAQLANRKHAPFGEFLVEQRAIDRFQLFRVLQHQDRYPQARIGHCVVALGYLEPAEVERLHGRFAKFDSRRADREIEIELLDLELIEPIP